MVSQVLPSDRPYFDVVVFDEASQVVPADATPAILRGRQLVVAGDDKQLPPTSFFAAQTRDEEDADPDQLLAATSGFESILDALAAYLPPRTLEWHYRSQDGRLIAFSNAHLYDRMLTTFPGVGGDDETVRHELVAHDPTAQSTDSSAAEVRRVVELMLVHATERPTESLGVIAMGIKHADQIEEALRRALLSRPELDAFFSEAGAERPFVKNLERVQGDERDAIILTIGCGKGPDGRMLYRFGPLNQEGGERRLNVAVTRARKRLTLVSSFSSSDMDPDRTRARGVDLLRLYLAYAESCGRNLGQVASDAPPLNPFEADVRSALAGSGIVVDAQVGCSGYRIDFAARHPSKPGQHVLAIECDGASYHSSATARDRDRLRQDHLERLGWRFHRIWSPDWFHHRESALAKVIDAYRLAVRAADAEKERPEGEVEAAGVVEPPPAPVEAIAGAPERGPLPLRVRAGQSIDESRPPS